MHIFISAGDHSGDIHAANLIKAARACAKELYVQSLGGGQLKDVSDKFCEDLVSLGGFGFWQPFKQYLKLKKIFNIYVSEGWKKHKPDVVVLVDYYGFNIHVARHAKKCGIPVYYFVGPQVWASRPGRIQKLKETVTKMLLILPFEEPVYQKASVPAVFVGNPMIDTVPKPALMPERSTPYIGLFPGSRENVLKRHLPIMLEAARTIEKETHAHFAFFASKNTSSLFTGLPYPVVIEDDYTERQKLTLAVTTSGTVSLENALLGIPMIVMYRLSSFNFALAKLLVSIPFIAMANILTSKQLVPELIQDKANAKDICKETLRFLNDRPYYNSVKNELLKIRETLGNAGVYNRAAVIILENK
jgi:lipid-A-disaccharide synthase